MRSDSGISLIWFKSSYSGGNETECLEVAIEAGALLLRDSKCPEEARVAVSTHSWQRFLAALDDGRFR
ncbi:DUF397 domain-containing protein [Streptomyces sp. NA04227]|nr:DUF397 domain-containing protein [Streptomyces sp. NA04227]